MLGAALGCFLGCKKKLPHEGSTKASLSSGPPTGTDTLEVFMPLNQGGAPPVDQARYFPVAEIKEATKNLSQKIGEGGFGPVFLGKTKEGHEVAVKVLAQDSHQGVREFFNEVNLLSRAHHRNLVSLLGYCHDVKERMLVYEYMSKGSLHEHLHELTTDRGPLDWTTRLNLALDSAKGLEYLHTGCNPSIIHRDVKSRNILLTNKMVAKVADFGLSKLTSDDCSHIFSAVQGTVGYLDPEYYQSQQLTMKSDVYSFGVVLLEILSGREALSPKRDPADFSLVNWARTLLQKGNLDAIIDPVLGTNYSIEAMWKFAELAMLSVEPLSHHRPDMIEVVKEITDVIHLESFRSSSLNEQRKGWDHLSLSKGFTLADDDDTSLTLPLPHASSDLNQTFVACVRPSAK